ncbi:5S rRNA binding protein [Aureococcus anophagefferens]|nr:5S rRNA binding protein [Aureococcus anophagefferens]
MPFVKIIKNKAYFKRYQVKYKRRREARRTTRASALITQDKNKYNTPKYRLVVRFSNKYVTCAVHSSELVGDKCIATATSKELGRYGLKVGLKNFAAAYCTGLLVARRLLAKVGLDELYEGNTDPEGEVVKTEVGKKEYYAEARRRQAPLQVHPRRRHPDDDDGQPRLRRAQGRDGRRPRHPPQLQALPGYDKESKEFGAEAMKDRIFGAHVSEYMEKLMDEDNAKYQQLFADYIKEAPSEDPSPAEKEEFEVEDREAYKKTPKLTYEAQGARRAKKAEMEEDDEDDEAEGGGGRGGAQKADCEPLPSAWCPRCVVFEVSWV